MGAALFALVFASYAWYVNSDNSSAISISNNSESGANLVIATNSDAIYNSMPNEESFIIDFDPQKIGTGKQNMLPATHDSSIAVGSTLKANTTGLIYPENLRYIDIDTGILKPGYTAPNDYGFRSVPISVDGQDSQYYVDYDTYIAATAEAIDGVNLRVAMTDPPQKTDLPEGTPGFHKAASIDFYYDNGKALVYQGTLNVAGQENKDTAQVCEINVNNNRIPYNKDNQYVHLVLRCYFDGALGSDQNKTYVNTYDLSADEIRNIYMTINFRADEISSES